MEATAYSLMADTLKAINENVTALRSEVSQDRRDSADSRRRMHEEMSETNLSLAKLDMRVASLERSFSAREPIIAEIITFRDKAIGAGAAGRVAWGAGKIIITVVASVATTAAAWWAWASGLLQKF